MFFAWINNDFIDFMLNLRVVAPSRGVSRALSANADEITLG